MATTILELPMNSTQLLAMTSEERNALPIVEMDMGPPNDEYCVNMINSIGCISCNDCINCINCQGCSFCIGLKGAQSKVYVAWGVQLTETEYNSLFV